MLRCVRYLDQGDRRIGVDAGWPSAEGQGMAFFAVDEQGSFRRINAPPRGRQVAWRGTDSHGCQGCTG